MLARAVALWVLGLLTVVPYGTYYLFFEASRDQYALLITMILFWIFGYWSLAGPLLMLVKLRTVFQTVKRAGSGSELKIALTNPDARSVAIDLIARENHLPRFVVSGFYDLLIQHLEKSAQVCGRLESAGTVRQPKSE